ncbi:MAG: hypothetical protein AABX34_01725 [Nanoarchaeota archaeon]
MNQKESRMVVGNLDVMIGIDSQFRYQKRSQSQFPYDLSQLVFQTFETKHQPPSRHDMEVELYNKSNIDGNLWYDGYAAYVHVPVDGTKTIRKSILGMPIGGRVTIPWHGHTTITLFYESEPRDGVYHGFVSFDERDASHPKIMEVLNTLAELFFDG